MTPENQDIITDSLHRIHNEGGLKAVKLSLRAAVVNFVAELDGRDKLEPNDKVMGELAEAIITPGFQQ